MCNLFILFAGEILLLIFAYLITSRDILAPSVLMCIMFIISTFVVILNANNWWNGTIDYSLEAVFLLLSGIFCFIIAETAGRFFIEKNRINTVSASISFEKKENFFHGLNEIDISMTKIVIVAFADIVICVLYYIAIINIVGSQYNGLGVFSAYRRMKVSNLAGGDEAQVGGLVSQLTNFVVISGYLAAYVFINNFIAHTKNKRKQLGLALIVLLSVLPGIMSAGRSQILRLFCAIIFYYYILWNQNYHWRKNISNRIIRIGIVSLAVGIPLFYYSLDFIGRSTATRSLGEYVSVYLGGSIVTFDQYVQNPVSCTLWGEETLVGVRKVLSYLGLGAASTSYNLEFRTFGVGSSNVYTFFRRPLHDFGIVGMYVFTISVGLLFAYMYWGKIKNKNRTDNVNKWTLVYGFLVYWIFISSIEQYSSNIISVGTIVKVILIVLGYWFVTKVHINGRVIKI